MQNLPILLFILSLLNLLIAIYLYSSVFNKKQRFEKSHHTNDFLTELNRIMASTILLEDLIDQLLNRIFNKLDVSQGALLLIDNNKISWAKTIGYESNPIFDEKILLHAFETTYKEIVIVDELEENTMKHYFKTHNRAILVALKAKGELEGVLIFGQKKSRQAYNPDDIKIIEFVAPEMAIAIKNAEAYEEIRKLNESLQKEVEDATSEMKIINEEMYKKNLDLKNITDQLANANDKLKQLDIMKDEFVSLASHELRTPMTAIKSYLWLFLETKDLPLNDKQKSYIERAYQATDRLISLVNDMLNVSRIESGRMNLRKEPFNLLKLLYDVTEELKPTTLKQQVALELIIESQNLPEVIGDQNKIREVIINLIGNSLKFTNPGGKIYIKLYKENDTLITQIIDSGKGISLEDLSKLFQKFQTVGNNYLTKMNSQGTGLGLYLSKSIIEMHGGKIWAESEGEGKGATFSFSLKIKTTNENQNLAEPSKNQQKNDDFQIIEPQATVN